MYVHAEVRTLCRSEFSPSTLWALGFEPRSSGLSASAFTAEAFPRRYLISMTDTQLDYTYTSLLENGLQAPQSSLSPSRRRAHRFLPLAASSAPPAGPSAPAYSPAVLTSSAPVHLSFACRKGGRIPSETKLCDWQVLNSHIQAKTKRA